MRLMKLMEIAAKRGVKCKHMRWNQLTAHSAVMRNQKIEVNEVCNFSSMTMSL